MRLIEALGARDAAVRHLADACASVRHKTITIENLQAENGRLERRLTLLEDEARTDLFYHGIRTRQNSFERVNFLVWRDRGELASFNIYP